MSSGKRTVKRTTPSERSKREPPEIRKAKKRPNEGEALAWLERFTKEHPAPKGWSRPTREELYVDKQAADS